MENNSKTVGPLKKVSLSFTAGTAPELTDLISAPQSLEFIFGIGTQGLTEFECLLDGKKSNDKGLIEVNTKDPAEFFGHTIACAQVLPIHSDHFFLQYTITGISDASPKDVVKSLAAAGGCGADCDCGCGSH